jgi:hypothetical protein
MAINVKKSEPERKKVTNLCFRSECSGYSSQGYGGSQVEGTAEKEEKRAEEIML